MITNGLDIRRRKILVLAAHPDDIEIGCLATIGKLSEQGYEIHFCVLTGSEIRKKEFEASCLDLQSKGIAISEFRSFDFKDGALYDSRTEIKCALHSLYNDKDFEIIFTHSRNDLHQDHRLIGEITLELFRQSSILAFEIPKYDGNPFTPQMYVEISAKAAAIKVDHLMLSYPTQRQKYWYKRSTFEATLVLRGVESGVKFAEAFEIVKWIVRLDDTSLG